MAGVGFWAMQKFDPSQPLPANLPVPVDDGACDHLPGLAVPTIKLRSTSEAGSTCRR
jgi:hypothetical protein